MTDVFGDGLLRTHVTWEDLQAKVKEIFGEKAVFGSNKTATNIGEGRGFTSKICLIDPDWQEKIDAPKKFVAKLASQSNMAEYSDKVAAVAPELGQMADVFAGEEIRAALEATLRRFHNAEIMMYNFIEKFKIDIPHPKIYATVALDDNNPKKGYILMEHIEGALDHHIYDNVTVEEIKQPLRGIAALEGASMTLFTEDELSSVEYDMSLMVQTLLNPQSLSMFLGMFRQSAGQILGDKLDKLEKLANEVIDARLLTGLADELKMKKVLIIGDIWATNLLWTKHSDGLHLDAVIDFQHGNLNTPAVDLVRLLGSCLSGKDRQLHWEQLLEIFYGYLLEYLKGSSPPYTLEQLKENYRRYLPFGGLLVVLLIGGAMLQIAMLPQDLETKKANEERILEKINCLVDDMIEQHERNLARNDVTVK